MPARHYTDLIAWQKAMDLVVAIYSSTEHFPQREVFGLTNQMRRASVSIPSNIAEGQGRSTVKDFLHYLSVARGSLQELETQIQIAARLAYLTPDHSQSLLEATREPARIINGLVNSLTTDN